MRLKLLILILMLLIATAILIWQSYHEESSKRLLAAQKKMPPTTQTVEQKRPYSVEKSEQNQPKPVIKSIDTDKWEQQLITQLSEPRYSVGLAVEMVSIGFEYEGCGNQDTDWFFQNLSLNTQQENIKSLAGNHCSELAKKYPFLTDEKLASFSQGGGLHYFPATTELGQYLQLRYPLESKIDAYQHKQNLIRLALQAGNAQMLLSVELASGFGSQNLHSAKSILGSTNQQYYKNLNSIALNSLSCQFNEGITCTPTAKFMAHKCYEQKQFCGLDFQQWFDLAVTPGMAKDIELLKQHYLQVAEL